MGWRVRQNLLRTKPLWRDPQLLTLTVDPKRFADPRDAYLSVKGGRFVPRLLEVLKISTWVQVLEFHKSGWPHWHIMLDRADCGGRVDYGAAWLYWRDRWGLGAPDFSEKRHNGNGSRIVGVENVMMYLTKYLTKWPDQGFPPWVLDQHSVKFVQPSRRVGPLVGKPGGRRPPGQGEPGVYRARKTMAERMVGCGQSSRVFAQDVRLGEKRWRFVGTLPLPPAVLLQASSDGELPGVLAERDVDGKKCVVIESGRLAEIRQALGFRC